MPDERRVTMVAGGPILVEGPVEITLDDGRVVRSDRFVVALCAPPAGQDLSVLRHQSPAETSDVEESANIDLTGRTALVTGSTQGIGLAIATGLARAGARGRGERPQRRTGREGGGRGRR